MLWGNKDAKTSTGTIAIDTAGVVTGTSTLFTTEAQVGDYIHANNQEFLIISIASATSATVRAGTLGGTITAVGAGNTYVLNEKPIFVAASEVNADANNVFGVDTTEVAVGTTKVAHAGWVRRTVGTGNRSGRVQTETLVAMGTIASDAADDTQFADA
jgi:hypothetical protein